MKHAKFYSPNGMNTTNGNNNFEILVNQENITNELHNILIKGEWGVAENILISEIRNTNPNLIKQYSQKVFNTIFKNKHIDNPDVRQGMELFQTAFLEMEGLFKNKLRDQPLKTGFDHLLGVLDNILKTKNPTIEQCIIAILHDSVEEIPGYTISHISEVYGEAIANSVDNLTKKYNKNKIEKSIREDLTNLLSIGLENNNTDLKRASHAETVKMIGEDAVQKETKKIYDKNRYIYYSNMPNWKYNELKVKFSDRLDALNTMGGIREKKLIKKMCETKKYFLIPEFKDKRNIEGYKELEEQYNKLLLELKNINISAYNKIVNN